MNTYWADITVKVMAKSEEMAVAILTDSLQGVEVLYDGQVAIKGIEWDMTEEEYAEAMPYDHFNE